MFIWSGVYGSSGQMRCYPKPHVVYLPASAIVNFFVPLVIMWTSYIGIIYKLKHSFIKAIYDITYTHFVEHTSGKHAQC